MPYEMAGETAHEWIGMAIFILFILHHLMNRRWTGNIRKGRYTPVRIIQTVLAAKLIEDTDKRRMTNYNFYTEQKWGKASNYTLCLNSSQLGYDRCEAIIMECR